MTSEKDFAGRREGSPPGTLMRGVIALTGFRAGNGKAEAPDRRILARRAEAVNLVRRNVYEVALPDLPSFVTDDHLTLAVEHVIELMGRVGMQVHGSAAGDLEFVDQIQRAASREFTHAAGRHEGPDPRRAIMLH